MSVSRIGIKPLAIGLGQAGGKIAVAINAKFGWEDKTPLINTSTADLESIQGAVLDKSRIYKLGDTEQIEGTGKDRSISAFLAQTLGEKIVNHVSSCLNNDDVNYDVVILCFSTAGGTGSGLGPRLTGMLTTEFFHDMIKEKYPNLPIIIGLAATPDLGNKEGYLSMQNTLECLKEIQTLAEKQLGRFFIGTNSAAIGVYNIDDRVTYLDMINNNVAHYVYRYFDQGYVSAHNVDRSDRLAGLRIMGLHAISSIDSDGSSASGAPFITPEGESVRRINFEIPSTWEKDFNAMLVSHGVVTKDYKEGLYEPMENDKDNIIPIIGYHGFRDIKRFSEAFDARLQQIKKMNEKVERDNINLSQSFNGVADERKRRNDEYGEKKAADFGDIFSELT